MNILDVSQALKALSEGQKITSSWFKKLKYIQLIDDKLVDNHGLNFYNLDEILRSSNIRIYDEEKFRYVYKCLGQVYFSISNQISEQEAEQEFKLCQYQRIDIKD